MATPAEQAEARIAILMHEMLHERIDAAAIVEGAVSAVFALARVAGEETGAAARMRHAADLAEAEAKSETAAAFALMAPAGIA